MLKNKNHNTKHLETNTMLKNLKSFKEYFTGQISGSFKPHMMYDPKTGDSKMANKEADHLALKKKGWGHKKEYVGGSIGGQRGPGLGNFRPMASMKKQEGTALHGYLIKAGIIKK